MSIEMNPALAETVAAQSPEAKGPQAANGFDIAAFREAMTQQAKLANPAPQVEQATPVASAAESEGFRSVIAMLDNLNGDVERLNSQAAPFTSGTMEMSPGDMLTLTVRCHEFLFHCQLTSNIANRSSEGVQQLFRQQS